MKKVQLQDGLNKTEDKMTEVVLSKEVSKEMERRNQSL